MKSKFSSGNNAKNVLFALLLAIVIVFSLTFAAKWAMNPESHSATVTSIDEKKNTAMALTGSTTLASVVVSALPDDIATPISDKLADLTQYFLIVLIVLYAEKYLLTVIGGVSFIFLIPLGCIFLMVFLFKKHDWMRRFGFKFIVAALILFLSIPASIRVSDMIYDTYSASINATVAEAEQLTDEAEELKESGGSLWDSIAGAATSLKDKASHILTNLTEALAVMLVTTCVIPIIVLLLFIWVIKKIFGINIPTEKFLPPKHNKHEDCDGDKPERPMLYAKK